MVRLFLGCCSLAYRILSRSSLAAAESQRKLEIQIATLLHTNEALAVRVRDLEDTFNAKSLIPSRVTSGTVTPMANTSLSNTLYSVMDAPSLTQLQQQLDKSRVYRRVRRAESLTSFSTSALGSVAWSVFTGLSLADISIVSAIALPIYPNELHDAKSHESRQHGNNGDATISKLAMASEDASETLDRLDYNLMIENSGNLLFHALFPVIVEGSNRLTWKSTPKGLVSYILSLPNDYTRIMTEMRLTGTRVVVPKDAAAQP